MGEIIPFPVWIIPFPVLTINIEFLGKYGAYAVEEVFWSDARKWENKLISWFGLLGENEKSCGRSF